MKSPVFPKGWDEERVSDLLTHYETQSEEECVAEDEIIWLHPEQSMMEVPSRIALAVRELIAKHEEVV